MRDKVLVSQIWQVIKNPGSSLTNTPFPGVRGRISADGEYSFINK